MREALLVGIVGIFAILDSRLLGRLNFERPLIVSTLTGLVLGDMNQGLILGASLELMSMGLVSVGAASPPDMVLGSIIATAFSILTGSTSEVALAMAVPIAVLAQMIGILMRTILSSLTHKADAYIEEGQFKKATNLHIIVGPILYALMYFVPIFFSIYFGAEYMSAFVDMIPDWIVEGLKLTSKILPAYGFALLLSTMLNIELLPFFLLGFFINAYGNLGITAIAIFSVLLAFILNKNGDAKVEEDSLF